MRSVENLQKCPISALLRFWGILYHFLAKLLENGVLFDKIGAWLSETIGNDLPTTACY